MSAQEAAQRQARFQAIMDMNATEDANALVAAAQARQALERQSRVLSFYSVPASKFMVRHIHSRQLPLDHSRERPHVSRDPVSLVPVSHPRTLVGVSCTPRARRWAGAPLTGGPPPTPFRGAGIRCLEGTGNSLSRLHALKGD